MDSFSFCDSLLEKIDFTGGALAPNIDFVISSVGF
jgi:hypothetical protein